MYIKCELVRQIKGCGNSAVAGRGEFIVYNYAKDYIEIWKRKGESLKKFKQWYIATDFNSFAQLTGAYPRYTFD